MAVVCSKATPRSKKNVKKDDEVESMLNYIEALESANESLMAKLDDSDGEFYSDDMSSE